jgi:hypothetical protein
VKILLVAVIAGIVIYLLLKLCLYLYRPFFLTKTIREIEQMYDRLLGAVENDLSLAAEELGKWKSGDRVTRTIHSPDRLMERMNTARAAKAHEEEMHGKFLILRERFVRDSRKLSESIVAYRRYLEVKLRQPHIALLSGNAMIAEAISLDEMKAEPKESMRALEESERKLDILLSRGAGV